MSFKSYNGRVRSWGRKLVLPVEEIKKLISEEIFDKHSVDSCVDMGAGTLFWSKWLKTRVDKVYAVDIIYDEDKSVGGIDCVNNINNIDFSNLAAVFFFISDVLHHLDKNFEDEILQLIADKRNNIEYVVIKDINCNAKIGNFMNRMHDRFINGEKIRDINPDKLVQYLNDNGFYCCVHYVRKLWYPHFLIVATRKWKQQS